MDGRKDENLPGSAIESTGKTPGKEEHKMFGIRQSGGQTVSPGNYWNFSSGERVRLTSKAVLPGDEKQSYLRMHPIILLLLAPVLGLIYAIFLPAIGIVMAVFTIGRKLVGFMTNGLAKNAAFNWQPSAAYLAQKKNLNEEKSEPGESEDKKDGE